MQQTSHNFSAKNMQNFKMETGEEVLWKKKFRTLSFLASEKQVYFGEQDPPQESYREEGGRIYYDQYFIVTSRRLVVKTLSAWRKEWTAERYPEGTLKDIMGKEFREDFSPYALVTSGYDGEYFSIDISDIDGIKLNMLDTRNKVIFFAQGKDFKHKWTLMSFPSLTYPEYTQLKQVLIGQLKFNPADLDRKERIQTYLIKSYFTVCLGVGTLISCQGIWFAESILIQMFFALFLFNLAAIGSIWLFPNKNVVIARRKLTFYFYTSITIFGVFFPFLLLIFHKCC